MQQTICTSHFTGKERDAESGNDYFNARYFGSSMGRFLSPDPLGGSLVKLLAQHISFRGKLIPLRLFSL